MKQTIQARFIQVLEAQLEVAHKQLSQCREDIEFYRGKVERLELAIMSNPPAQQEYVQTQVVVKPEIRNVRAPAAPPHIPFSDLKRKWNTLSADEQQKAIDEGWEVGKQPDVDNVPTT